MIPAVGSSGGLLTNIGRGAGGYSRDHPNGYMQNYSADFQYDLGRSMVIEIGYAGHQGRKLVYGVSINDNQLPTTLLAMATALDQRVSNPFFGLITSGNLAPAQLPLHRVLRPYPEFDTVTRNGQTPGGSSSYNSMLVKISKQFSGGLMLMSSYQWSKAIDNIGETEPSPGGAADGYRDNTNFRIERSLAAHDLPHSMVTALVYTLPFGKGQRFAFQHRPPLERTSRPIDRAQPHQPVWLRHPISERQPGIRCLRIQPDAGTMVQYGGLLGARRLHHRKLSTAAERVARGLAEKCGLLDCQELPRIGADQSAIPRRSLQLDEYSTIRLARYHVGQSNVRGRIDHHERRPTERTIRPKSGLLTRGRSLRTP